jgi:hypothetical protein
VVVQIHDDAITAHEFTRHSPQLTRSCLSGEYIPRHHSGRRDVADRPMPVVFGPVRSQESERRQWLVRLVAGATLVNGLASIGQPLLIPFRGGPGLVTLLLPFELYQWSRSLTVAFGFLLAYLSLHLLYRRATTRRSHMGSAFG